MTVTSNALFSSQRVGVDQNAQNAGLACGCLGPSSSTKRTSNFKLNLLRVFEKWVEWPTTLLNLWRGPVHLANLGDCDTAPS